MTRTDLADPKLAGVPETLPASVAGCSNLVRDLASVNEHEALPWDGWSFTELAVPDEQVDALAVIVVADVLDDLRRADAADGIRIDGELIGFSADPPHRVEVPDLG